MPESEYGEEFQQNIEDKFYPMISNDEIEFIVTIYDNETYEETEIKKKKDSLAIHGVKNSLIYI